MALAAFFGCYEYIDKVFSVSSKVFSISFSKLSIMHPQ